MAAPHVQARPRTATERLGQASALLAYVVVSLPIGAVCAALLLASGVVGVLLSPLAIGFPILNATAAAAWHYARLERALANRMLGARIPPLPPRRRIDAHGWRRLGGFFRESGSRRAIGLALLKLPATAAAAAVGLAATALVAALVVLGVEGFTTPDPPIFVGGAKLGVVTGVLLLLVAVPAGIVALAVLGGLASALRALAHSLLASAPPPGSPVREMLAESLGDRNLQVAYWLPDRQIFVDERGAPVELPEPGSGRAWTSVDRGGRRVAAIVHDADLDAGPELVQAAAAAAALALENEQLKADLRARLEELRASRMRIVDAGDAARRRLERDLHDGAQQQLVALALDLRLLKARVHGDGDSAALVERANAKLAAALEELRELARGIHPAILTDRGFVPAVQALTRRVSLPIDCDLPIEGRLPDPVEAAAYFVVAEAITNVVKYSQASHATVRAWRDGDVVEVEVVDDGVGGADRARGSGLRGLEDRLSAVDGTLDVRSPLGEGTRVHARIPCGAGALVREASEQSADFLKHAASVLQSSRVET
jgi:signal transduction histidine kinase